MARQVTVHEAAEILRMSERTVERRVNDGTLASVRVGRRRLVTLPDEISEPSAPATEATEARLAALVSECDGLRNECAMLRQRVADLESERDYLRVAHATALGTQRLLAERAEARPSLVTRLRQWVTGSTPA